MASARFIYDPFRRPDPASLHASILKTQPVAAFEMVATGSCCADVYSSQTQRSSCFHQACQGSTAALKSSLFTSQTRLPARPPAPEELNRKVGVQSHPPCARQLPQLLTLHKSWAVSQQDLRRVRTSSSLIIVGYRFLHWGIGLAAVGRNRPARLPQGPRL